MFKTIQDSVIKTTEDNPSNKTADMRNITEKFVGALSELESAGDVELMVALFADDCEIGNVVVSAKFQGPAGARRFWTHYRAAFREVCSIFQNELHFGNEAKLQWKTEGKSVTGRKLKYEGVSVLEIEDGKITRFHAYFDKDHLQIKI